MAYIPERIMSRFLPCYAYSTSYIKLPKYSKIWWFDKSGDVGYLYIFMRWDVNMSYSKHINITILDTSHPHDKLCPPNPHIDAETKFDAPDSPPDFPRPLPGPWPPWTLRGCHPADTMARMRCSRGTVPSGPGGGSWGSPNHWIVWPVGHPWTVRTHYNIDTGTLSVLDPCGIQDVLAWLCLKIGHPQILKSTGWSSHHITIKSQLNLIKSALNHH